MSKTWLLTGSSRRLGRALAEAVLAAGHRLVATARKPDDLRDLVARYSDSIRAVALDVTDPAAARGAVDVATSAFGRLDVVVNNAGYANVNSIEDMADEDFRAQFETNFFGVVNVTRAALPVMRRQGGGHIVQISSIGGRGATPGLSAYQSAKYAVGGFSEVLASGHGEFNDLGRSVDLYGRTGVVSDAHSGPWIVPTHGIAFVEILAGPIGRSVRPTGIFQRRAVVAQRVPQTGSQIRSKYGASNCRVMSTTTTFSPCRSVSAFPFEAIANWRMYSSGGRSPFARNV
jgi:NAD(P)-dependent dehydrogenase (short-subunit alcohol dehydrogenase family)